MTNFLQKVTLTILISCLCFGMSAQKNKMRFDDPKENFYDTQKRLNKIYKKHEKELAREKEEKASGRLKVGSEEEQELAGYELYKRWEHYMSPRVYPSGDKTIASRAWEEHQRFVSQNDQQRQGNNSTQSSTWQPVGPFGDPSGGNAGRINSVRFDPANTNGLWICTPDGGVWSSPNNGGSWSTNTDLLSVIGTADVAFDPTNPQNMFLATGDGDATDSYSIGVLKSTNGGATWNATGLTWAVSAGNRIYKLLINPLNKNVLFAATTGGLYRTTNGGTSWNVVLGGSVTDIEYKSGDTTTVYGVTDVFFTSTNGGSTFTSASTGLPAAGTAQRLAIAVTSANASYVYVVASDASSSGFLGFYQSTNSGGSFATKATSPNLMGWAFDGSDTGGQGWYTLSTAASPGNQDEVVVGGVNTWRTLDGGATWTIFSHWTATGAPFVHADCHDLIYKDANTIYAGTDGGIFTSSNGGTSFSAINGSMNIAEIYKIGLSKNTYNLAITGHQDNGTNTYGGGWGQTMGGDGMDCFIDWSNDLVMYGEQYSGSFNRTTDGGASWTGITTGLTGSGGWVTPWHQDPVTANTIYGGYVQMFKSTNQGTAWTQMGTIAGGSSITEFAVAPSNPQVIYVIKGNGLYKTTNGGTSWSSVTTGLPTGSASLKWVTVEDDDANSVWVCFSSYSSGNKVYKSTNGGAGWTNYSTGLPNLPTNCITYCNATKDALYLGCDVGIYYRDSTMASWIAYNTGLPNVSVSDLAIFYPLGKVRAATFGRGVWEADLYNNGTQAALAYFVADQTFICAGNTVNFTDQSTFSPTVWNWVFQGGTPATSTAQNPSVVYSTPGTYSASLTATNANGGNTYTRTLYITVSPIVALPLAEGFQAATFPPTNWQNLDAVSDNIKWKRSATVGKGSTASMYFDNYNQNASGTHDEMRTPKYDFTPYTSAKLFFDVAYARYDATYSDTLALMVSTDCGQTFTQVYVKGGTTLATAPDLTTATFIPTAAQWRTDTVSLNAYAGMGNVMVAFQNRGHYGQAIYVDNINIVGANSSLPPNALFVHSATVCTNQSTALTDQSTNTPTSWNWQLPGGSPSTSTVQNPVVTYTTAGVYTITLIATNAVSSSTPTTQTVSVKATPTVTANSPAAICAGGFFGLSASGATTYTWQPGNHLGSTFNVFPSSTTVYTVTGKTAGCTSPATTTVTVNPLPVVAVNSDSICAGSFTTLNALGATTYSWTPATGLSSTTGANVTANPTVTTSYSVTGTDVNNCTSTAVSTVVIKTCMGIATGSGKNFAVYPNPANDRLFIETPKSALIKLINITGQVVLEQTISIGKNDINIAALAAGAYNLMVNANGQISYSKVMISK
jgi:PKD repeat protein